MQIGRMLMVVLASQCTTVPPPPVDALDAAIADVALPACRQPVEMYALGVDNHPMALPPGADLPVTQGFQGFLFVRLGLRSPQPLPAVLQVKVHAVLDNGVDVWVPARPVKVDGWQAGGQSRDVPVYFNDTPLPELLGRKATLEVVASAGQCALRAQGEAVLVVGGFMAADAGFWADVR